MSVVEYFVHTGMNRFCFVAFKAFLTADRDVVRQNNQTGFVEIFPRQLVFNPGKPLRFDFWAS